jgi:hypothetical protein
MDGPEMFEEVKESSDALPHDPGARA